MFIPLARRFQLKWASCPLSNVRDFHFLFTFGADLNFTSSKFWKSNKWRVGINIKN